MQGFCYQKNVNRNKNVVIFDSFGEDSLTIDKEHSFTHDYLLFPVSNALMSICLVESIRSSLNGTTLNLDTYKEGLDYVLTKAHEYELKINKDLDSLTKQELEEFSEYMMSVMTEYVKEKFNISEIDLEEVNKKVKKEKAIKDVAFELAIDYENRIREITNKILKYKDRDIEEMDTVYIGNNVHNFPIKTIL